MTGERGALLYACGGIGAAEGEVGSGQDASRCGNFVLAVVPILRARRPSMPPCFGGRVVRILAAAYFDMNRASLQLVAVHRAGGETVVPLRPHVYTVDDARHAGHAFMHACVRSTNLGWRRY